MGDICCQVLDLVTLINRNVGMLHPTSYGCWGKIVYYSYLMRHNIISCTNSLKNFTNNSTLGT
ncbi:hypothetical protein [Okeania sp. KiyG1]|uniref:hypothetical protein n=1 Tax=Okeania sp. KiyG1 TaxID=2720165 RepID=UPI001924E4A9|nr:hypothetical protein [Okeania sp. KiyG1]